MVSVGDIVGVGGCCFHACEVLDEADFLQLLAAS